MNETKKTCWRCARTRPPAVQIKRCSYNKNAQTPLHLCRPCAPIVAEAFADKEQAGIPTYAELPDSVHATVKTVGGKSVMTLTANEGFNLEYKSALAGGKYAEETRWTQLTFETSKAR